MKIAVLCIFAVMAGGCVSITPRAQQIQLLPAASSQLSRCTRLGTIDATASAISQINAGDLDHQAQNNLRDAAAARWNQGVDSVGLITVDHTTTKATAHGIAYACRSR